MDVLWRKFAPTHNICRKRAWIILQNYCSLTSVKQTYFNLYNIYLHPKSLKTLEFFFAYGNVFHWSAVSGRRHTSEKLESLKSKTSLTLLRICCYWHLPFTKVWGEQIGWGLTWQHTRFRRFPFLAPSFFHSHPNHTWAHFSCLNLCCISFKGRV